MSFEGYYQKMCSNQHYIVIDCYTDYCKCPHCNASFVWSNLVDTTNGGEDGFVEAEPLTFKTIEVPDTYKIPEEKGD